MAAVVSNLCRLAMDALWNAGGVGVKEQVGNEIVRGSKGWSGLSGIASSKNICEAGRQFFCSSVGTFLKDIDKVTDECMDFNTHLPKAMEAIRSLSVACTGTLRAGGY